MADLTRQYGDFEIRLDPASMRFEVRIGKEDKTFDSFDAAKTAIDVHEKHKQATERRKVSIKCLLEEDGAQVIVKGIHAGNGNLIANPKVPTYGSHYVVIDHSITRELIAERQKLSDEIDRISERLKHFRVLRYSGYESWHAGLHERWVDSLEKTAAAALKLAESKSATKDAA